MYDILKRSLPKFEISIETIHHKVAWALTLLDNDDERALERDAICVAAKFPVANITALLNSVDSSNSNVLLNKDVEEAEPVLTDADAPRAANSGFCRAVLDLAITVTPKPSVGKKKAKAIAQQAASANKKMKVQLPSNQVSLECLASAAETKNKVGKRMALAVEAKNGIAKEQSMIQVFLANPQSVASLAFLQQSLESMVLLLLLLSSNRLLPSCQRPRTTFLIASTLMF